MSEDERIAKLEFKIVQLESICTTLLNLAKQQVATTDAIQNLVAKESAQQTKMNIDHSLDIVMVLGWTIREIISTPDVKIENIAAAIEKLFCKDAQHPQYRKIVAKGIVDILRARVPDDVSILQ